MRMVVKKNQVLMATVTNRKLWWIPGFVWAWMVKVVVKSQKTTITVSGYQEHTD